MYCSTTVLPTCVTDHLCLKYCKIEHLHVKIPTSVPRMADVYLANHDFALSQFDSICIALAQHSRNIAEYGFHKH